MRNFLHTIKVNGKDLTTHAVAAELLKQLRDTTCKVARLTLDSGKTIFLGVTVLPVIEGNHSSRKQYMVSVDSVSQHKAKLSSTLTDKYGRDFTPKLMEYFETNIDALV